MDLCGYFPDPGIFLLPAQIKKGILKAEKIHEMKWHENAPVFYSEKYTVTNSIVRNNRAGTECNIREYYAIRKSAFCNGGSKEWRRDQNRYLQKVRFVRG